MGGPVLIHPISPVFLQGPAATARLGVIPWARESQDTMRAKGGREPFLFPFPFPILDGSQVFRLIQASWGSQHHFQKEACLMHGTIWGCGKNYEVPNSFFQEDFESIFFQQSAFSYSSEYVISWCLYLYLLQTPFFYSIGVYRLL